MNSGNQQNLRQPTNQQTIQKNLESANELKRKGDYLGAITLYNSVIGMDQDNFHVFIQKAECLKNVNQYDEAIVCSNQAINQLELLTKTQGKETLKKHLVEAYLIKAESLEKQRKLSQAKDAYKTAIAHSPDEIHSHEQIIQFLIRNKKYLDAIKQLFKALSIHNNEKCFINLQYQIEELIENMEENQNPIQCINELISYDYKNINLYQIKAKLLMKQKSFGEATSLVYDSFEINSDILFDERINFLITILNSMNNFSESLIRLEKFIQLFPHNLDLISCKAQILVKKWEYNKAIDLIRSLPKYDQQSSKYLVPQIEKIIIIIRQIKQSFEDVIKSYLEETNFSVEESHKSFLEEANFSVEQTHQNRITPLLNPVKDKQALDFINEELQINPFKKDLIHMKVKLLRRKENLVAALDLINSYFDNNQENKLDYYLNLSKFQLLQELHQDNEARIYLEEVIRNFPNKLQLYNEEYKILRRLSQYAEASLGLFKRYSLYFDLNMSETLKFEADNIRAIFEVKKYFQQPGYKFQLLYAQALLQEKEYEAAIEQCDEVIELNTQNQKRVFLCKSAALMCLGYQRQAKIFRKLAEDQVNQQQQTDE